MKKSTLLVAVLGTLSTMSALAADAPASPHTITSNVGITTNYIYRGISQTSTNPAIQGGFDYAHASGFYAGVWGSNVSWIADSGAIDTTQPGSGAASMELDTYLGFKNSLNDDMGYDVGYVRYNYMGDYTPTAGLAKADTAEVYAAFSYKFLTAKYSYSVLNQFLTVTEAKGTNYIELNANYTIPDTTYTLIGHVGKQTYKGSSADTLEAAGTSATYTDYKVGVAKDFSGYVVTVAYSKTDATPFYTFNNGNNWARGMTAVSLTRSF